MIPTAENLIESERKFLHELANSMLIADGMATYVQKCLKNNKPIEAKEIERLDKAIEAIKRMSASLAERREYLHSIEK